MRNVVEKIKNLSIWQHELLLNYLTSFLCGMLGAIVIFIIIHTFGTNTVPVAIVNITGMVDEFIKQEANKNVQPDDLKKEVRQFGINLNKELQSFSREKHIVLMPSEAVIAGSHDYTLYIYQRMQRHQAES